MSRVGDFIKAEQDRLSASLVELQGERAKAQASIDEIDARIAGVQTEIDALSTDIAALPQRMRPEIKEIKRAK